MHNYLTVNNNNGLQYIMLLHDIMQCIIYLLCYMFTAQNLYKVTPTISCILIGIKMLGQHTIESFILK